jgi:hypothetical protein
MCVNELIAFPNIKLQTKLTGYILSSALYLYDSDLIKHLPYNTDYLLQGKSQSSK